MFFQALYKISCKVIFKLVLLQLNPCTLYVIYKNAVGTPSKWLYLELEPEWKAASESMSQSPAHRASGVETPEAVAVAAAAGGGGGGGDGGGGDDDDGDGGGFGGERKMKRRRSQLKRSVTIRGGETWKAMADYTIKRWCRYMTNFLSPFFSFFREKDLRGRGESERGDGYAQEEERRSLCKH